MPASFDLDETLRAALFARMSQLRARYADRIPAAELSKGIWLDGKRISIWNQPKGIFKPHELGSDGAALSVHTSVDSPYADEHDPETGRLLYKYQGTDPVQRDNVALRHAMERQRPLLYLVGVDPGVYDAVFPVYVTGDDPLRLQFTLMADQLDASTHQRSDTLTVLRRAYTTRAVMARLHQQQFRRIVLQAYANRCAICRLRHLELLDAAHILPDHDPRGEPIVPNGLGLCKIHHSAFDSYIIGIDPDARVHVRDDILSEIDGPMLRYGLQEAHGTTLLLPRRTDQRPARDFLAERFERFKAA